MPHVLSNTDGVHYQVAENRQVYPNSPFVSVDNSYFVSVDGQCNVNGQTNTTSDSWLAPVASPGSYPLYGNGCIMNSGLRYADGSRQNTERNGADTVDIDKTNRQRVDMPELPNPHVIIPSSYWYDPGTNNLYHNTTICCTSNYDNNTMF